MEKINMNFFRERKATYIQKEFKKIYGYEPPWTDYTTFQLVKTHYLGEILKLSFKKSKRSANAIP
jgi:hypothetical protein